MIIPVQILRSAVLKPGMNSPYDARSVLVLVFVVEHLFVSTLAASPNHTAIRSESFKSPFHLLPRLNDLFDNASNL